MLEYWLWLVMVLGAGNPKIWSILSALKSPEKAYEALQDESEQERFQLTDFQKRSVCSTDSDRVRKVLENCEKKNISAVCFDDEDYPEGLKHIYNPPAVLFYQGNIRVTEDYPSITVVGTRKPTEYSVRVASRICGDLAGAGVVIVSGFAVGLDSAAHRAAILAHGRTVAVLGCGVDVDYPRENAAAKKYIARKGLVVSEFLPGTEPYPKNFPMRNRILSGLSRSTLIVQAPEKSGSLITANLALEQGKNVYCVPPADIFDNRYAGVVKYLRDGAVPVFSYLDILNEYYPEFAHRINPSVLFETSDRGEDSVFFGTESDDVKKEKAQKNSRRRRSDEKTASSEAEKRETEIKQDEADRTEEKPSAETAPAEDGTAIKTFAALEGLELDIAVLLSQEHQMHIDAIAERLEADEDEAASALTELIIKGYVVRLRGQLYGIA